MAGQAGDLPRVQQPALAEQELLRLGELSGGGVRVDPPQPGGHRAGLGGVQLPLQECLAGGLGLRTEQLRGLHARGPLTGVQVQLAGQPQRRRGLPIGGGQAPAVALADHGEPDRGEDRLALLAQPQRQDQIPVRRRPHRVRGQHRRGLARIGDRIREQGQRRVQRCGSRSRAVPVRPRDHDRILPQFEQVFECRGNLIYPCSHYFLSIRQASSSRRTKVFGAISRYDVSISSATSAHSAVGAGSGRVSATQPLRPSP